MYLLKMYHTTNPMRRQHEKALVSWKLMDMQETVKGTTGDLGASWKRNIDFHYYNLYYCLYIVEAEDQLVNYLK